MPASNQISRSIRWIPWRTVALAVIVLVVVIYGIVSWTSDSQKCRDAGGVYVKSGYRYVCIKGDRIDP